MAYITDLTVSLNQAEQQMFQAQGFKKIDVDLKKWPATSPIYLWYKKGSGGAAVTRVQVTFTRDMEKGLINAGYAKINKNLNVGAGGDCIYLWYYRGQTEYHTRIVDIDVTISAQQEGMKFKSGWERLACDLNRWVRGTWVNIWVKREKQTYICDVAVTVSFGLDANLFRRGYIRVDEDTNAGVYGAPVFIWSRQTTDAKRALTALNISTNDSEYQALQQQNYKPVSVNLNEGTNSNRVFLWYKKDGFQNIKAMTVLVNPDAVQWYENAGVSVITRNLNSGNDGMVEYLCFYK